MTPLAQRILQELTLPKAQRRINDEIGLVSNMTDIHCFECSAVQELAGDISDKMRNEANAAPTAFLPAPKAWIEWRHPDLDCRLALLCEEMKDGFAEVSFITDGGGLGAVWVGQIALTGVLSSGAPVVARLNNKTPLGVHQVVIQKLYAFLAMINTPRIIGRQQHMPHRGLERTLLKQQKLIGKFPLHAWTEIKLEVTPPYDASEEPPEEGHYTGKKALHFCRQHLRIRHGKLELVSAHWRGDPALGIKQSRYTVVPPKCQTPA